ncbi:hypothetical protein [Brevundimonas mediterranea]
MTTREMNLLLLDAGVKAPTGMAQQAKRDVAAQMRQLCLTSTEGPFSAPMKAIWPSGND